MSGHFLKVDSISSHFSPVHDGHELKACQLTNKEHLKRAEVQTERGVNSTIWP